VVNIAKGVGDLEYGLPALAPTFVERTPHASGPQGERRGRPERYLLPVAARQGLPSDHVESGLFLTGFT
jgi:hypothetical protein